MKIYHTQQDLKRAIASKGLSSLGFVPTMGALHDGHLSLVKMALSENEACVVSIFVNPTQFDNQEDLKKYPRTLQKDAELLAKTNPDILIYAPDAADLYGANVVSQSFNFGPIAKEMEGASRQGHFDGVGTIVSLLFDAVQPTAAYFGQKDFQQLQIIKKLVAIKKYDIRIVGCAIVREENGLARSSRNTRLTQAQFNNAAIIYKILQEVKKRWKSQSIKSLNQYVEQVFTKEQGLRLEYFVIANEATLKTAQRKRKQNTYRAFIVVHAGAVRLIDNMALGRW